MKYVGSKSRHAKEIINAIKKTCDWDNYINWVEPFVGGANMIDKVVGKNRIGNDSNKYVIALLEYIKAGKSPEHISESVYRLVRQNPELFDDYFVGFAGICCSYLGKWFGGYAGNFKARDYITESINNLNKQKESIKDVIFCTGDYRDINIPIKSIVYCDPPYAGTTKYGNSYFDTASFWYYFTEVVHKDNQVFVSEYSIPAEYEDKYKVVWQKWVNSSLTQNTGGKKSVEKLYHRI